MSKVINSLSLKYLERNKLEEFKYIKNISVQFNIRHLKMLKILLIRSNNNNFLISSCIIATFKF